MRAISPNLDWSYDRDDHYLAAKRPVRCEQSGRMAPTWTIVGERERCPQCLNRAAIRNDGRWARHNYPAER